MARPGPRLFAAATSLASPGTATVALLAVVASVAVLKTVGPAGSTPGSASGRIDSRVESEGSTEGVLAGLSVTSPVRLALKSAADMRMRPFAGSSCSGAGSGTGMGAAASCAGEIGNGVGIGYIGVIGRMEGGGSISESCAGTGSDAADGATAAAGAADGGEYTCGGGGL